MSNRRFRGSSGTLTREQLRTLGCIGKGKLDVDVKATLTYPPLLIKPINPKISDRRKQLICLQRKVIKNMHNTGDYISLRNDHKSFKMPYVTADIKELPLTFPKSRNSYDISKRRRLKKEKVKVNVNWLLLPDELHELSKSKRQTKDNMISEVEECIPKKVLKIVNDEDIFKMLDARQVVEIQQQPTKQILTSESTLNVKKEQEFADEAADDEMDDENDYDNSYFDNGESYNDDDDYPEDGPIY